MRVVAGILGTGLLYAAFLGMDVLRESMTPFSHGGIRWRELAGSLSFIVLPLAGAAYLFSAAWTGRRWYLDDDHND